MTLSSRPVRDFYRFSSTENDEIADSSQDIERQPISLRPLRRQHLSEPVQHTGTKTEWEPRFNELQKKYNDVSTYQLIQNLRATSFDVVRESLSVLRLRCGKDKNENEDRDVLIGQNGVDVLIQVIRTYPDTSLVNDALCVLTNISALDTSYTLTVAHSGFLDLFPSFLASPSPDIVNQALWTLSHIAADSANLREFILLNKSIVPALEPLISLDNPHLPYVLFVFCNITIQQHHNPIFDRAFTLILNISSAFTSSSVQARFAVRSSMRARPFKDALRVVQQLSSNNPSRITEICHSELLIAISNLFNQSSQKPMDFCDSASFLRSLLQSNAEFDTIALSLHNSQAISRLVHLLKLYIIQATTSAVQELFFHAISCFVTLATRIPPFCQFLFTSEFADILPQIIQMYSPKVVQPIISLFTHYVLHDTDVTIDFVQLTLTLNIPQLLYLCIKKFIMSDEARLILQLLLRYYNFAITLSLHQESTGIVRERSLEDVFYQQIRDSDIESFLLANEACLKSRAPDEYVDLIAFLNAQKQRRDHRF